jgi:hypothetical protein
LSAGYVFGDSDRILFEPSLLFQLVDKTKRKSIDINMKAYKNMAFGKVWELFLIEEVLNAEYTDGNGVSAETAIHHLRL